MSASGSRPAVTQTGRGGGLACGRPSHPPQGSRHTAQDSRVDDALRTGFRGLVLRLPLRVGLSALVFHPCSTSLPEPPWPGTKRLAGTPRPSASGDALLSVWPVLVDTKQVTKRKDLVGSAKPCFPHLKTPVPWGCLRRVQTDSLGLALTGARSGSDLRLAWDGPPVNLSQWLLVEASGFSLTSRLSCQALKEKCLKSPQWQEGPSVSQCPLQ